VTLGVIVGVAVGSGVAVGATLGVGEGVIRHFTSTSSMARSPVNWVKVNLTWLLDGLRASPVSTVPVVGSGIRSVTSVQPA